MADKDLAHFISHSSQKPPLHISPLGVYPPAVNRDGFQQDVVAKGEDEAAPPPPKGEPALPKAGSANLLSGLAANGLTGVEDCMNEDELKIPEPNGTAVFSSPPNGFD